MPDIIDNTKIQNIEFIKNDNNNSLVCYISDLSDDLKNRIKNFLTSIFHGEADVIEDPDIYNFKDTLSEFMERYQSKNSKIKKGMIGELLTHVLIKSYIDEFQSISVFKNKEEKSIKKGFDIVYFNDSDDRIWYSEVKAGGDTPLSIRRNTNDQYNRILLERAKTQIAEEVIGERFALWDSVKTDIQKTISSLSTKNKIKNLLKKDFPNAVGRNLDRNIILVSVLYRATNTKIDFEEIKSYRDTTHTNEPVFTDLIVFSIQKETYIKIEQYLELENLSS